MNVINKITKAEGREQITMFLYVINITFSCHPIPQSHTPKKDALFKH